jgi:secreted PhoX family phosphatase
MTAIHETAYPRLRSHLTDKELRELYPPTPAEVAFVQQVTSSTVTALGAADPMGTTALGTLNNCAHGVTPWGTYLTCEENFNGYFVNPSGDVQGVSDGDQKRRILRGQNRYGITKTGAGHRWHEHDERFDASRHPNEPYRFGWVVEVDPFDPQSQAVKHTGARPLQARGRLGDVGAG